MPRDRLVQAIRDAASYLGGSRGDYNPLLRLAEDAQVVLLGEATHGSHELYRERARITQRLVDELGFSAVVVEGDWPDADRVNRWVQLRDEGDDADAALAGFTRFPAWMWRNRVVVDFVEWLRAHNDHYARGTGFYGMDLYGLQASVAAILRHLDAVDPHAAQRARRRYGCFDHHAEPQAYGYAAGLGLSPACVDEVVAQLREMQARAAVSLDPEVFSAAQNARLAHDAEAYYRSMFGSRHESWNLRDRHMMETLAAIHDHLVRRDGSARIVVWAHNSHVGDARATEMGEGGELSLGQLVRARWGPRSLLCGFTTYDGTVTAAHDWDSPPELLRVRPALPGSVEQLFHDALLPRFFLPLRDPGEALGELREPLLERAIGVVYRPQTERQSHYSRARVAAQFDAIVHVDRTRGVEPLERVPQWTVGEPPETWPSAL